MASITKTIEIIFSGVDNLGPTLDSVGGGISKVGQGVSAATQPLADLSDTVLLTSAAITALGVAALAFSASAAIDLENAFIELQKVLSDTDGTAQDFGDTFGDISNKFGVGQADVIKLAADFKQAGFTIDESLGLVTDALTAAAISELDVDAAGSVVIRTLNGFQEPASEAARLIDILNASSNSFAVSFDELGTGMARVSPIAKQLGFSFEETAGLLIPIIEVFGSGSEAANGLRTSLLKLASDSKPVIDALESIGIDTSELVTAKERFTALSEIFPTLTEVQKTFVTTQIAGIEQAAKFSIVLGNQKQVLKATQNAYAASGSAAAELAIALASTELALERFKNSFINIGAAIGTEFLPQLAEVANSATNLNSALLDSLSGANFTQVFDALRGVFVALSNEIDGIAEAFPEAIEQVDFAPILEGLDAVSDVLGDVFGDVDLTTPEGLAKVIQLIVDSLGSLAQLTAGIISEFDGVFQVVAQGVDGFNDLSDSEKFAAGEALGFGKILNSLGGILDTVGTAVQGIGVALGVLLGASGIVSLGTIFTTLSTALVSFVGFATGGAGAAALLGSAFSGLVTAISVLIIPLTGLIAIFAELKNQSISGFIDEITDLSRKQEFAADSTASFGQATGEMTRQLLQGEIDIRQFNQQMDEYSDAQILAKFATIENTEASRENTLSLLKTAEAIEKFKEISGLASESTDGLGESLSKVAGDLESLTPQEAIDRMRLFAEGLTKAGEAGKGAGDSLSESAPKVDEFGKALEGAGESASAIGAQLDSIDGKSAGVSVTADTSSAQTDLEKFRAILSSVDSAIESTGTTLTSLGDLFGSNFNNLDLGAKFAIQDAFREEIKNREKALDLQNRLIETEIRLQEAKLRSLESGDALITIDTTGLEPILDLLLTTIIERAQVRASVDGAAFLVGAL